MEFRLVTDQSIAKKIFMRGISTNDTNSKNYTLDHFEKGWKSWLSFHVLYNDYNVVGFSGIRDYGDYARIFDRYFIFPKYRKTGLKAGEYNRLFITQLMNHTQGKIPFFSMEFAKRRPVIFNATRVGNEELPEDKQFHVLPGLYETMPNSWQNISIIKPYDTISLNHKPLEET